MHALATPPAFVLSQDQTLHFKSNGRFRIRHSCKFGIGFACLRRLRWASLLTNCENVPFRDRSTCALTGCFDRPLISHLAIRPYWQSSRTTIVDLGRDQVPCKHPAATPRSHGGSFTLFTCQRAFQGPSRGEHLTPFGEGLGILASRSGLSTVFFEADRAFFRFFNRLVAGSSVGSSPILRRCHRRPEPA